MGKLIMKTSPFVHSGVKVNKIMINVLISLIPVTAFAIYSFGINALVIILVSVITMVAVELIDSLIRKKENTIKDCTAIISGLIFALTLPAHSSIFSIIVSAGFGMFLGKIMFGGLGNNIFNVAALSRVIYILTYNDQPNVVAGATSLTVQSTSGAMNALSQFNIFDLFTGIGEGGAIGEVSAVCILIGAAWLLVTKSADWKLMFSYIGFSALFAAVAAIFLKVDVIDYTLFNLVTGGLLFGAVFMATDPVTAPVLDPSKVYYGFGLAAITMIIRLLGALPEGVVFSILLMNMLTPALEYPGIARTKFTKKSIAIFALVVVVTCGLIVVGL